MFNWLTNLVDDARIAFSYPGYESECRKQLTVDAERTYSTRHLEEDIDLRMAKPKRYVISAYIDPSRGLEKKRKDIQRVVADAGDKLSILERDYKSELDSAYALVNQTREALDACRRNLSDAYVDLKSAKSNLDSWYSKAEGNWFGNGGKRLPNHAFFGQDLSDRDRYKSRRDSAAQTVGRYKSERTNIEHRLESARSSVQRIKDARQVMFDLKIAGFDRRIVMSAINNGNRDLHGIGDEITRLAKARDDYIHMAKASTGVYALEADIARIRAAGAARLKAFDSDPIADERRRRHRTQWLVAHGK